jgi:hypothetical protein
MYKNQGFFSGGFGFCLFNHSDLDSLNLNRLALLWESMLTARWSIRRLNLELQYDQPG